MRILGLDPGLAIVGYGVIDVPLNNAVSGHEDVRVIDYGIIRTCTGVELSKRLQAIYEDTSSLLDELKPDLISIEKLFFYRMGNTIAVAQARGILLLCMGLRSLQHVEFSPPQVKLALTGDGRACKQEVQQAVARNLQLTTLPRPDDAADGLALALTAWYDAPTRESASCTT